MNDANKETNAAYEEPKKKVYVKLLVFLVLITAIVVVLGAKFVSFYYKTHGIGGRYFYKGCEAEVVHQLPEGLTDEDISNAVIMRTYNRGEANDYENAGKNDFFVESHYLMGVQSIDDETCKVYILSNDGHYKGAGNMYSGGLVVRMLDFKKQDDNWTMTKMWEPRGGAMYEGSIRETIPSELADLIFSDEETEIKKTITDETEEKVKAYYDTDEVA